MLGELHGKQRKGGLLLQFLLMSLAVCCLEECKILLLLLESSRLVACELVFPNPMQGLGCFFKELAEITLERGLLFQTALVSSQLSCSGDLVYLYTLIKV